MDMGELLPKGQLAVEPAADQRPVALVHQAQSEQPSDRTNEPPRRIDSQTTACWLNIARGTTDPGYRVYNLNYLFNYIEFVFILALVLVQILTTR